MAYQAGHSFKAYYSTGSVSSPTWTELTDVEDVTEDNSINVATVKNRGSKYERGIAGQHIMAGTLRQTYDKASTGQLAILAAYEAGSVLPLAIADGPIATTGTIAMQLDALITSFNRSQGLDDAAVVESAFVPHGNSAASSFPDIVIVAGS